ncbi:hypothetical protein V4C53_42970 [Paraburkholderia azotifigens]|uniref:hypothetical protein n=1 Tax=Paraburkholderia azotifigens TaxID=2057004 RepID=UPI0031776E25
MPVDPWRIRPHPTGRLIVESDPSDIGVRAWFAMTHYQRRQVLNEKTRLQAKLARDMDTAKAER